MAVVSLAAAHLSDLEEAMPLIVQAALLLRRARKFPAGPARNDLRRLARLLLRLHQAGVRGNVQVIEPSVMH